MTTNHTHDAKRRPMISAALRRAQLEREIAWLLAHLGELDPEGLRDAWETVQALRLPEGAALPSRPASNRVQ